MGNTAFELREEYAGKVKVVEEEGAKAKSVDKFTGGVVAIPPDGTSFDVKEELEKGGGRIVTSDRHVHLNDILRGHPALKEVKAPADAKAISAYEHQGAPQLLEEAKRRGLEGAGGKSKHDLVALLEANDKAVDAGDQAAADAPQDTGEEG